MIMTPSLRLEVAPRCGVDACSIQPAIGGFVKLPEMGGGVAGMVDDLFDWSNAMRPQPGAIYFLAHSPLSDWIHQPGDDLSRQLLANSFWTSASRLMSRLLALMISAYRA